MADEREGEVPPEDVPKAFNRQPVWARMAIVAAGPLINLVFCQYFYFGYCFYKVAKHLKTVVGTLKPNTPAMMAGLQSGDQIMAVDGKKTTRLGSGKLCIG
jgi:regulator of sigma E protease